MNFLFLAFFKHFYLVNFYRDLPSPVSYLIVEKNIVCADALQYHYRFDGTDPYASEQDLLLDSISDFFLKNRENMETLLNIIDGKYTSLRLIDWFVTNYSKIHNTSYILNNQKFCVYMNYKNQLKAYSKKLFDPFCRRERILFQITS